MAWKRIVNASPFIFLTRLGLLDILNEPGVTVVVPTAVVRNEARTALMMRRRSRRNRLRGFTDPDSFDSRIFCSVETRHG